MKSAEALDSDALAAALDNPELLLEAMLAPPAAPAEGEASGVSPDNSEPPTPIKRGRGRPKGSTTGKTAAAKDKVIARMEREMQQQDGEAKKVAARDINVPLLARPPGGLAPARKTTMDYAQDLPRMPPPTNRERAENDREAATRAKKSTTTDKRKIQLMGEIGQWVGNRYLNVTDPRINGRETVAQLEQILENIQAEQNSRNGSEGVWQAVMGSLRGIKFATENGYNPAGWNLRNMNRAFDPDNYDSTRNTFRQETEELALKYKWFQQGPEIRLITKMVTLCDAISASAATPGIARGAAPVQVSSTSDTEL